MCGSPLSSWAWARRSLFGDGTSARSAKQHEKERLGLVPGLVSVVVGAAADPFDGYQGRRWHLNRPMVVFCDIGESCFVVGPGSNGGLLVGGLDASEEFRGANQ